ncbi:MAG: hypothetical protein WBW04_22380 [Nitrolancea sp.]
MDSVRQIATTVLYEGYILWPYRRSARKNQQRWTFGGVYPRVFSEASGGTDPWMMQTECLTTGDDPAVDVSVRFLQVVKRQVYEAASNGEFVPVDQLQVGSERYLTWDEAVEREIALPRRRVSELAYGETVPIAIETGMNEELLGSAGKVVRSWESLIGEIELCATTLARNIHRITVRIRNLAPDTGLVRDEIIRHTFVSTHTVLQCQNGEFVSLTDPPALFERFVAACDNVKTWPVLAGEEGDRHAMLSSPIILSDYPAVAPESSGDLFDGGEIDQLLLLNVMSMTDEEKEEMRATDPRSRAILERTEALTANDFMHLHGTFRDFQVLRDDGFEDDDVFPTFDLGKPATERLTVGGVEIGAGSRVRLRPRKGGDIFDLALDGKIAIVERIDQDYEDRVHLAVTIEDDPGRELANDHVLGHRFFFSPDEVEPLDPVGS